MLSPKARVEGIYNSLSTISSLHASWDLLPWYSLKPGCGANTAAGISRDLPNLSINRWEKTYKCRHNNLLQICNIFHRRHWKRVRQVEFNSLSYSCAIVFLASESEQGLEGWWGWQWPDEGWILTSLGYRHQRTRLKAKREGVTGHVTTF